LEFGIGLCLDGKLSLATVAKPHLGRVLVLNDNVQTATRRVFYQQADPCGVADRKTPVKLAPNTKVRGQGAAHKKVSDRDGDQ
jgi:hypothetical protein